MKPLRRPPLILTILVLFLFRASSAFSASTDETADARWAVIEAESRALTNQTTTPDATGLIALADRLRDFRIQNQRHAAVAEAKQREAAVLVQAAFLGEGAQDARLGQLVAEIRMDRSLDPSARLQLAASADNLAVERRSDLSPSSRLDEFERVARALHTEFPDVAEGYTSLLAIAKAQPEGKGAELAREITQMPNVPGDVSLAAADHVARCALVGRHYLEVIAARDPDGLVDLDAAGGKPVVFYSWASNHGYSQWLAGEIARIAGRNVVVVGLKLNGPSPGGTDDSRSTDLPGLQFDSATETGGLLRWSLRLNEPGLVYLVDVQGVILTVSAQNDLIAQLGALAPR